MVADDELGFVEHLADHSVWHTRKQRLEYLTLRYRHLADEPRMRFGEQPDIEFVEPVTARWRTGGGHGQFGGDGGQRHVGAESAGKRHFGQRDRQAALA